MNDDDILDEVQGTDRRWFENHPKRFHYVRWALPGEVEQLTGRKLEPIPIGFRWIVAVQLLVTVAEAGQVRMRKAGIMPAINKLELIGEKDSKHVMSLLWGTAGEEKRQ